MESKTPPPLYHDSHAHASVDGVTFGPDDDGGHAVVAFGTAADDDGGHTVAALRRELTALRAETRETRGELERLREAAGASASLHGSERGLFFHADDDAQELSPRTVRRLEKASEEVQLEASMWDVAVFIGTPVAGCGASFYMTLLLVANICFQFSFAIIVQQLGRDPALDDNDVDELKWWRRNIAHSSEYYNEAKGQTLARRVCNLDFGIEVSGIQAVLHGALDDYLGKYTNTRDNKDTDEFAPGKYLTMLAVCLWIMSVFIDLRATINMLVALRAMPKGATEIRLNKAGEVAIERLSRCRFVGVCVVQLFRILVGAALVGYGCYYLVHTIEIGELILNAVALEFVLRVDELIYACFAPQRFKALIRHAKPLSAPSPFGSPLGIDLRSLFTFFGCVGIALGVYFVPVLDQERTLIDAQHAMCGGDLDVVYAVDNLGVPWWSTTPNADTDLARFNFPNGRHKEELKKESPDEPFDLDNRDGTRREQLIDVLLQQYGKPHFMDACNLAYCDNTSFWGADYPEPSNLAPACCFARSLRLPDPLLVMEKARASFEQTVALENPSGIDVLNSPFAGLVDVWKSELAATAADASKKEQNDCPFAKPLFDTTTRTCVALDCFTTAGRFCAAVNETGRRTRALCPDTCGCNFPQSPLALSLPQQGCGAIDDSGEVRQALGVIPCEDVSRDGGSHYGQFFDNYTRSLHPWYADRWTLFQRFLDNVENASTSLPAESGRLARLDVLNLREHGCAYLSDPTLWHDLSGTWFDMLEDSKNETNGLVKPPYFLGRNICVRGGWSFKPLSLFCPEACGCHRGDRDCPTMCPTRLADDEECPEYQTKIFAREYYHACAQQPRRQPFNIGVPVTAALVPSITKPLLNASRSPPSLTVSDHHHQATKPQR